MFAAQARRRDLLARKSSQYRAEEKRKSSEYRAEEKTNGAAQQGGEDSESTETDPGEEVPSFPPSLLSPPSPFAALPSLLSLPASCPVSTRACLSLCAHHTLFPFFLCAMRSCGPC